MNLFTVGQCVFLVMSRYSGIGVRTRIVRRARFVAGNDEFVYVQYTESQPGDLPIFHPTALTCETKEEAQKLADQLNGGEADEPITAFEAR